MKAGRFVSDGANLSSRSCEKTHTRLLSVYGMSKRGVLYHRGEMYRIVVTWYENRSNLSG